MHNPTTTGAARSTLWVTLIALLLVAMTSQVRVRTCIGDCSDTAATLASACCEGPQLLVVDDESCDCCGCCDESEPQGEEPCEDGAGDCEGGCCITIAFDVDMAPNVDVAKLPAMLPAICWIAPLPQPEVRVLESARPFYFDRGPPRIDGRTALRATTVLLI